SRYNNASPIQIPRNTPRNPTGHGKRPAAASSAALTVGTSSCTKVSKPSVAACTWGIHSWNPKGSPAGKGLGMVGQGLLQTAGFLMCHRGRRGPEVFWQPDLQPPRHDRNQSVVMNRVRDAINEFAANGRSRYGRIPVGVAHLTTRSHR